jgi:hypothetical protein
VRERGRGKREERPGEGDDLILSSRHLNWVCGEGDVLVGDLLVRGEGRVRDTDVKEEKRVT